MTLSRVLDEFVQTVFVYFLHVPRRDKTPKAGEVDDADQ